MINHFVTNYDLVSALICKMGEYHLSVSCKCCKAPVITDTHTHTHTHKHRKRERSEGGKKQHSYIIMISLKFILF